jgi:hypothetical protein
MPKKFIPDGKFCMLAKQVDGMDIAEYFAAPFGLGRRYGLSPDRKEEWDPEGLWVRVQDKGLPVLYNRDAIYTLDVVTTTEEGMTSTTTSTTSTTTTTAP